MSVFLGIDFGSKTCRTAVLRNGSLEVVSNRFCERGLPLLAYPCTTEAEVQNTTFPIVFRSLKQELGSLKLFQTVANVHSLADKISDVLRQLREDVGGVIGEPVDGAVVGIPGFFLDSPRAALRDAALGAGFDGVRLLDEALAAVLGAIQPLDRGNILVYALGSGVFSATGVILENGKPKVVSAEGNRYLGGAGFDIALASLILSRLDCGTDFTDPQAAAKELKSLAEHVKIGLSRREEELFDVNLTEFFGEGGVVRLTIRRNEFEGAISEPVNLTMELTKKAIEGAGFAASRPDVIVLVGDSTRIPLIERRLSAEYCVQRVRAGDADIARGAALFGGQIEQENWKRREPAVPVASYPKPIAPPQPAPVQPAQNVQESSTWVAMFSPHLLKAEELWKSGDRSGAIGTFVGMLDEAHVYLGTLYHTQGQIQFRAGNYDEAIDVLKQAARYTPAGDDLDRVMKNYHESLNRRAVELAKTGRWEEAWTMIRKALEINPNCQGCVKVAEHVRQALKVSVPGASKKKKRK